MGQLQGKVALITGAGMGIGRSSALLFAREGARVVVADVDIKGGEETAHMIKKTAGRAFSSKWMFRGGRSEALVKKAVIPMEA